MDEELPSNLSILSNELTISGIPYYKKEYPGFNLVLNDNWTLYYWAKVLREHEIRQRENRSKTIIIHIDDHYDCMSPLLFTTDDRTYLDPITGLQISMDQPECIASAIESGSITIGSFIPPFFHHLDEGRVPLPDTRKQEIQWTF